MTGATGDCEFTLIGVFETVAAVVPDRVALSQGKRRQTYAETAERSRRLASYLYAQGLGASTERVDLAGHESGQDHIALLLYNSPEYVEGMLGGYRARTAPFNVNYRYVGHELAYVFRDASARAVIFHSAFAPVLASVLDQLDGKPVLLQVDDGSAIDLLPGAVDYEEALAGSDPKGPPVTPSPDDLYVLYTGGTTGMPKGVLWRQHDIFMAAMGGTGIRRLGEGSRRRRHRRGSSQRTRHLLGRDATTYARRSSVDRLPHLPGWQHPGDAGERPTLRRSRRVAYRGERASRHHHGHW